MRGIFDLSTVTQTQMSVLQLPLQKVRLGTLKVQKVASLMTSSPIDPGAAIKKY